MKQYITRSITKDIVEAAKYFPVITITGPRQSGKSTLCRHTFESYSYTNLEDITTRAVATEDPQGFLDSLGEHAVIDEVQSIPSLLSAIQVRVDSNPDLKYILTGSSNFSLMNKVSQSLAGRTALFVLLPLSIAELPESARQENTSDMMLHGFYPAEIVRQIPVHLFYNSYYNTYVERDLRDLLKVSNIAKFDKFMRLLALRVGSELNINSLAIEVGVSVPTINEWLSILEASYLVYQLRPYFNNRSKRVTKSPKIYFTDTGLLCFMLGISTSEQLNANPVLRGMVFENMAVIEILKKLTNSGRRPNIYFYRERSGIEVDIISENNNGLNIYEVKSGKTLQNDYMANMKRFVAEYPEVKSSTVIYDGPGIGQSVVNIRDI